jgi:hypothetical protein
MKSSAMESVGDSVVGSDGAPLVACNAIRHMIARPCWVRGVDDVWLI